MKPPRKSSEPLAPKIKSGKLKSAGRPRADQVGQAQDRILDAATRLFLEQGFARTTFDQVVEVAHVSKTTLYGGFATKEALFTAVVSRSMEKFQARMALILRDGTDKERLIQVGIELANETLTPESIALMRVTSAESDSFPHLAQEGFKIGFGACVQCIAECLASSSPQVDTPEKTLESMTPLARRFVEMALHPLYMHAFFGADLGSLRERAEDDVTQVANILFPQAI